MRFSSAFRLRAQRALKTNAVSEGAVGTPRVPGPPVQSVLALGIRSLPRQALIQALTFLAGLLVIRTLSREDYGYYTIGMSLVGTATQVGDLGLAASVTALAGKHSSDPPALEGIRRAALRFRFQLALWSIATVLPLGLWLLRRAQCPPWPFTQLLFLALCSVWLSVPTTIHTTLARCSGRILQSQDAEIVATALRLLLVGALAAFFLTPGTAVLVNVVIVVVTGFLQRQLTANFPASPNQDVESYVAAIRRFVRRQAPNSIYGLLEPQLVLALATFFGGAVAAGQIGALGRLAAALAVLGGVLSAAIVPSFAREQNTARLKALYVGACLMVVLAGATGVVFALLLPEQLLWILGGNYRTLHHELLWGLLGTVMRQLAALTYSLNAARGFVFPPRLAITAAITTQVAGVLMFDVSTVSGLFMLSTLLGTVGTLLNLAYAIRARNPLGRSQLS